MTAELVAYFIVRASNALARRERELIVDDDDRFRARLVQAFRERGFEVRSAADYDEAMTSAGVESPELALVGDRQRRSDPEARTHVSEREAGAGGAA